MQNFGLESPRSFEVSWAYLSSAQLFSTGSRSMLSVVDHGANDDRDNTALVTQRQLVLTKTA
jgi:hypothetical protein